MSNGAVDSCCIQWQYDIDNIPSHIIHASPLQSKKNFLQL